MIVTRVSAMGLLRASMLSVGNKHNINNNNDDNNSNTNSSNDNKGLRHGVAQGVDVVGR